MTPPRTDIPAADVTPSAPTPETNVPINRIPADFGTREAHRSFTIPVEFMPPPDPALVTPLVTGDTNLPVTREPVYTITP